MARSPQTAPPVLPGFAYVRPLGSGGFADVFLYEQDLPRRAVAVKVLSADAIDQAVRQRFTAEADVMAGLSAHPAIVTIFQASISSDGRPYLAMEYCAESMGDRYKRQPLDLPTVLDTGVRMASALETAHRAGVLHRDIKPSNILIGRLGQPQLADFGIAATAESLAAGDELVAMSIPWSAPEMILERTTGTVASEVWSLGATLYTLLAGRSPFASPQREKNTRELMRERIARAAYPPLHRPDVPPDVERLLARTLARDPAARPATMLELAEELRHVQALLGLPQTPVDVAGAGWARGAGAAGPRGPVVTTVQEDSRRARRAARQSAASRDPDEVVASSGGGRMRVALVAAAIGVVVAVGGTLAVLFATGALH